MALDWFKLHADWPGHPKSLFLAARLGNPMAWAHVVLLWCYVARKRSDGSLAGLSDVEIAGFSGWGGDPKAWAQALREASLLDEDGAIHDWAEINPAHVQSAAVEQSAQSQKSRNSESPAAQRMRERRALRTRGPVNKPVNKPEQDSEQDSEQGEQRLNKGEQAPCSDRSEILDQRTGEQERAFVQNKANKAEQRLNNEQENKPPPEQPSKVGTVNPIRFVPTEADCREFHQHWRESCDREGDSRLAHYQSTLAGAGFLISQTWRSEPIRSQPDPRQALYDSLDGFTSDKWRMAPGQLRRRDLDVFLRAENVSLGLSRARAIAQGIDPDRKDGPAAAAPGSRVAPEVLHLERPPTRTPEERRRDRAGVKSPFLDEVTS